MFMYMYMHIIYYIFRRRYWDVVTQERCASRVQARIHANTHTHTHPRIFCAPFREHRGCATPGGTQFACFTGTNIQTLTQKGLNLLALLALLALLGRRAPEAGQRASKRCDRCGRAAPLGRQVSVCCLDGTCSTGSARKRERHGNVAAGEHAGMCGARCGRICTFVLALLGLTST